MPRPARPRFPARRTIPGAAAGRLADFTGRDEQVKRLCDLLTGAGPGASSDPGAVRIAVVAGAGGLGKTSLAVHAAHRVRRKFGDGQLYVDLLGATPNPLPAGDVLARFLRDLGVDGRDIPVDEAERAARYRTTLARRRMLVVLDNARDAAQVRPLLPGTASSAVLVTTRSRMPDLASTKLVDLNVLDHDEALKLFVKVVGEERAAAEPEATAELLDACAGLPLAIRICGARLATRSGWTIQAMATRLRDVHRRLDEMRAGDLAVRASFQVSFASLPASTDKQGIDPARAFCLLGLWQGSSISSAAAAALFGVPEYSAEDALEVLVDTHLLESTAPAGTGSTTCSGSIPPNGPRPTCPRRPGRSRPPARLVPAPADAAAWPSRRSATTSRWMSRRAASAAQLHHRRGRPRLVRQRARQPGRRHPPGRRVWPARVAWRLPAPLFSASTAAATGRTDCDAPHRARQRPQAGNRQGEAWVLTTLARPWGSTGAAGGRGPPAAVARHPHPAQRDRNGEARAAQNLAEVQYLVNGAEAALPVLHQSLDVQRAGGQPAVLGATLNNLGEIYLELGRLEESVECLQRGAADLRGHQVLTRPGSRAAEPRARLP